ncbi:MAG: helix-turn-helix domain-containing protein [Clostridium perfringens]|nr:helix-turn-helix domain-containing protein [Clostridium perfringens]
MRTKSEPLEKKWGENSMVMGWTAIPTSMLFLQAELSITPLGFNILINLISHWWESDEHPYPSQESLAKRMGVSKRSIQREISSLIEKNLLEKTATKSSNKKYKGRNTYDLSKMVRALNEKTPEKVRNMQRNRIKTEDKTEKEIDF